MGEDPEIKNIPMPEPPPPGKGLPLTTYFPYIVGYFAPADQIVSGLSWRDF